MVRFLSVVYAGFAFFWFGSHATAQLSQVAKLQEWSVELITQVNQFTGGQTNALMAFGLVLIIAFCIDLFLKAFQRFILGRKAKEKLELERTLKEMLPKALEDAVRHVNEVKKAEVNKPK